MTTSPAQTRPPADDGLTIRQATSEDAAEIISLVLGLAEYEKLPPPDEAAQARLIADAFAPRPRFEIFLAEAAEQVIGYAFVFETYSTFLARPTLYLEDLFVLPEFRGRGAGAALIRECARQAVARGCGRLEWVVLDWNELAIGFYQHLGARHMSDWHIYRLDGAGLQSLGADESGG